MNVDNSHTIRLNKLIASRLAIGRRQADILIQNGHVRVNNKIPLLGAQINPQTDLIKIKGQPLSLSEQTFTYVLLNKPRGYICSRRQQDDTPTIYSLLPKAYEHLKTVGRLDKDSSGVLLLTNDGDLAYQLTHPRFHKVKQYEIELDKPLEPLHQQMISDIGITLPDGLSKLQLERSQKRSQTKWLITMHEGRNRQIRRTFAALGYTVIKLHRTHFGSLSIKKLHNKTYMEIPKPQ